jgi:hypothetical protein
MKSLLFMSSKLNVLRSWVANKTDFAIALCTKNNCLLVMRWIILVATLAGFFILYRFADYSQDEPPITEWDTATFYILEAFMLMMLFTFLSLIDTTASRFFYYAWALLAVFFAIRLYMEIYAVVYGVDINAKIITAIMFYVVFIVILWLLIFFPRRKEDENQN